MNIIKCWIAYIVFLNSVVPYTWSKQDKIETKKQKKHLLFTIYSV